MKTVKSTHKTHRGQIRISYWWKCSDFGARQLPQSLRDALDESAQERAFHMIAQGYRSGELIDYVNMAMAGIETPQDGFECRGWWAVETA